MYVVVIKINRQYLLNNDLKNNLKIEIIFYLYTQFIIYIYAIYRSLFYQLKRNLI